MGVHWPILRRLLTRAATPVVTDDTRTYRGVELLVASMHAANVVASTCRTPTIGLMLPTSGAFPIAALGSWIAGRTIVPLNYMLKAGELQHIVDHCGTDTIITVRKLLDHVQEQNGRVPTAKNIVLLEDIDFKKLPKPRLPASPAREDTAAIIYTSGTSGLPKGVELSHANLRVNIWQGATHMELRRNDRMLGVLPQFHSFGLTQLTLTPLTYGIPVIYSARFVPKRIVELVREHQATVVVGIPSMYNLLARVNAAGPEDLASLRLVVSGSEPLPDAVFDRFAERYDKHINEGYGMTEMAPFTHCCRCDQPTRHSVGPPAPKIEQRICHIETGEQLPQGEEGEIRLRGPNMMKGYYNNPEATAEAFDDQGYYRTGDIGRFDERGFLFITGRLKEMMIVGGENVFPREIEDVLKRHPAVKDCGCVGAPDPRTGETPVAFVELTEEAAGTDHQQLEKELRAHCREHLAGYKIPGEIRFIDDLPRNPTGKVLRRVLKERLGPAPATA